MTDTVAAAHGRWREILPALGVAVKVLNGRHQPCPSCGGKDRFRFDDKRGDGDYFCSHCGAGKGFKLLQLLKGWDFKTAAREVDAIVGNLPAPKPRREWVPSSLALRDLYQSSRPVTEGDPVATYLAGRGIDYTPVSPKALRYHPALKHRAGGRHPGMIAVFSDASGKGATIHRTYLTPDGRKAELDPVRMFWPGSIPAGGAIRLAPAAATMGIAEGIETALCAWQRFGHPVWATTAELQLQRWRPPPEVKRVIIYGDNDKNFVGQHAAYVLGARLIDDAIKDKVDLAVKVRLPRQAGLDWADDGASDD